MNFAEIDKALYGFILHPSAFILWLPWWAMTDSNRRQPRCKRGALPAELIARGAEEGT